MFKKMTFIASGLSLTLLALPAHAVTNHAEETKMPSSVSDSYAVPDSSATRGMSGASGSSYDAAASTTTEQTSGPTGMPATTPGNAAGAAGPYGSPR